MNEKVKKIWHRALKRSRLSDGREVKQIRGSLATGTDKFCALGVLCEEAVLAGVIPARDVFKMGYGTGMGYTSTSLPREVRDWAGLTTSDPQVGDSTVAKMNDSYRKSFAEIAEAIKEL